MEKICVVSPKCTSKSAKWLAESLKADYVNPYQTDKTNFSDYTHVINYGYSGYLAANNVVNHPDAVQKAVDKTITFSKLDGHCRIPEWTTDKSVAIKWAKDSCVVCRTLKKGKNAKGMEYAYNPSEVIDAKFYTKYINHKAEYRVNVFGGKVISVLEKHPSTDGLIKFKLVRNSPYTFKSFIKAVGSQIGLDLYGMDILLGYDGKLTLLEVNSGPVMFGQTAVQMLSAVKKEVLA